MILKKKKALVAANIAMWVAQGLYTISPIDLIPDIIPLLGWMDDALGLAVTVAFTVYTITMIRKYGVKALLPAGNPAEQQRTLDRLADAASGELALETEQTEIVGYEPIPLADLHAL